MAGQLVQVDTETVTSSTATVTLTGIDSDDVYMVAVNNVTLNISGSGFYVRVTTSGTADSDSEYDIAYKQLRAGGSFANTNNTNGNLWDLTTQYVATGVSNNGIFYLYNFNNSSEYSFITNETAFFWSGTNQLTGNQGGAVHTVAEANDGIHFVSDSGRTFESGTFTLYKVI
tara:strand:+ start:37 stop:552 length:516 start_codon:yes stop_codon:yes gene_type:complete